jgi:hypothetical protein
MTYNWSLLWQILKDEMSFNFQGLEIDIDHQELEKDLHYGVKAERFIQIDRRRS